MKAVHIKSIVICFLFGCSSSGLLAEQNLHNENARVVPQILSNVSVDEHDGLSAVQKNLIRGETYPIYSYRNVTKYRYVTQCLPICRKVRKSYRARVRGPQIGTKVVTTTYEINGVKRTTTKNY